MDRSSPVWYKSDAFIYGTVGTTAGLAIIVVVLLVIWQCCSGNRTAVVAAAPYGQQKAFTPVVAARASRMGVRQSGASLGSRASLARQQSNLVGGGSSVLILGQPGQSAPGARRVSSLGVLTGQQAVPAAPPPSPPPQLQQQQQPYAMPMAQSRYAPMYGGVHQPLPPPMMQQNPWGYAPMQGSPW